MVVDVNTFTASVDISGQARTGTYGSPFHHQEGRARPLGTRRGPFRPVVAPTVSGSPTFASTGPHPAHYLRKDRGTDRSEDVTLWKRST